MTVRTGYWWEAETEFRSLTAKKWIVVAADAGKIRSLIETSDGSVWAAGDKGVHRELYGSWFTVTAAGRPAVVTCI